MGATLPMSSPLLIQLTDQHINSNWGVISFCIS